MSGLVGAVVRHPHECERGTVQAVSCVGETAWLLVLLPTQRLRCWRHDEVEVVGEVEHGEVDPMHVGELYELLVRVRARVTEIDGDTPSETCVRVELETRQYSDPTEREVCLDVDEIESAERIS